jgi:hypothetical protein
MKIAIVENRFGRLKQFTAFDLQEYKEVAIITGSDFATLITDLEAKRTGMLDKFDCIASHRSALPNEIRDILKEYCKSTNKPLIFFSGGITTSVYKDSVFPFLHINSKDFYSLKLKLFLEYCQHKHHINLLVLQFGHRWKLSLLLYLRNRIAVALQKQIIKNNDPTCNIKGSELIRRVMDIQINSLIKDDLKHEKTNSILTGDQTSEVTEEQIKDLMDVINQSIISIV